MTRENFSMWNNWRYDVPAAIVVVLVALPLCLGIAVASGVAPFSGIIAGIIGGIVIGFLSKSPLSVCGPAAGLTVIVLNATQQLPSLGAFSLAVCLAGIIQIGLGLMRAGVIGDFIPSSVIKGMLAAIGIILMLKQFPHAVGYDKDFIGDAAFFQIDGENTFSALAHMLNAISLGALIISFISLVFLFWWDKKHTQFKGWLRYLPSPLVVVIFGVVANMLFGIYAPSLSIIPEHMVAIPIMSSPTQFFSELNLPDIGMLGEKQVWIVAVTLALVASIETLLSIEAVDKLDPYKRITPTNRELFAQGVGNMASGLIGGLPITSVIVRSSANVNSGGRTQMSTILHGVLLLLCVMVIPALLNKIPLAALAAILIALGYKLTKPAIFRQKYEMGYEYFVPFVATIVGILLTDLLIGIGIGIAVAAFFILVENYRSVIVFIADGNKYLLRFKKDVFLINKYELKQRLSKIPDGAKVLIDLSRVGYMDMDNVGIINDFISNAGFRDINVTVQNGTDSKVSTLIKEQIA